jgi:hypothetical protein
MSQRVRSGAGQLDLQPGMLVCFIDESGDERMSDPGHPVFGMGGCAVMAHTFDMHLDTPWRRMKARHFGGEGRPLHAAGLRPTDAQLKAIGDFFRRRPFPRFAAFLSRSTRLPPGSDPMRIIALVVMRRIAEVASTFHSRPTSLAFVFEDTQRLRGQIQAHFDGMTLPDASGRPLPTEYCFATKAAALPGLEVADFVMHAGAGQVRARVQGKAGWRRDYAAVFQSPRAARSFIDIESVSPDFVAEEEERFSPHRSTARHTGDDDGSTH